MTHGHQERHLIEDHEDPDGWATWAIGLGGTFLMITTVAVACGIYYNASATDALDKSVNIRYEERDMMKAAQAAVLEESARWVEHQDPDSGKAVSRLVIPIDTAMDIVAGNTK